jgi:S-layer homology domain.
MKRVLSLVLALVLVLGMIPTFAADATGAQNLYDNGFITGKDGATVDAKLDVNAKLTRAELAALIAELNGAKEEAAAFAQPADFTDSAMFQDWAKPYIAYAQENGWMTGYPDGSFQADKEVPAQQLAAVLLNALGYTFEYNTVLATAAELGIVVEGASLTRGEAFAAMWTAVSEVLVNGEEVTLGVKLGKLEPATPVVTDLEVKSVSATNLREVMVEFNNEIDADELDKANFTIGTVVADSVSVSEDGKTVVALFTLQNQSTYTLDIASVVDVNGSEVKDFEQQFTVTDFVAPTVTGVEVIGNKKLVVTFSEPVKPAQAQILSNYKIDDLLFGAMVTVDERTVTIITSTRLTEGVHTLKVDSNVVDYADFKLVSNNNQFVVAKDTTVAAVSTVESATQVKVVVTLTKAVESGFTVSSTSGTYVDKTSKDNQTWTLNFSKTNPLPLSGTEIKLKDVVDYYGNKTDLSFNVVPTLDLTRPEVVSVTADDQSTLLVKFSKDVMTTLGTFTIKTVADVPATVAVTNVAYAKDADDKDMKDTLALTGAFAAKDYTIEITGVTDTTVQANVMVPYTGTVTVADLTAPTVVAVRVGQPTTTTTGTIIVEFSEKVDTATALDKANFSYILNSTTPVSLGTAHTIAMLSDGKSVKITVPKNATGTHANDVVSSVTITNVKDLAGNKVTSKIAVAADFGTLPTANVVLSAPTAVAKNKVTLSVNSKLNPASVTASDFKIYSTTGVVYVINAEYSNDDDEITLTLASDLTVDAKIATTSAQVEIVAANLTDIYGNKVAINATGSTYVAGYIVDGIAPEAVKVVTANSDATTAVVKVNLTEALDNTDVNFLSEQYMVIKINGVIYTPSQFSVTYGLDGTTPQLTFTVTVDEDMTGKSYSVEYFKHAGTTDAANVQLATFTFTGTLQ